MSRSRSWCFTLNNPGEGDTPSLEKALQEAGAEFYIWGEEGAPKTGTVHYQGYVHFKLQKTFRTVQKLIPRAHLEVSRGSITDNIKYCSKEERVLARWGTPPSQGKRSDLEVIAESVEAGANMREMLPTMKNIQQIKIAEKLLEYGERRRDWETKVLWFWGPTGSGKSRVALEMYPDAWISGKNLRWWQGYDAHAEVIIDEFRDDFCTFHELLRILDRYPYTLEVKGGQRQLLAEVIVITSNKPWWRIYESHKGEDLEQLGRRITHTIPFPVSDDDLVHKLGYT